MLRELKIWLKHLEIIEEKPEGFYLPDQNHRRLKGKSRRAKMSKYQLFAATARRYREELRRADADNRFVDRVSEIGRQWVLANAAQKVDSLKSETVDTRNRAFTYLLQLELRIRRVGQFVFRDDPERLSGYCR